MAWMEMSTLAHVMHESGPWRYAIVNLSHILGVATLFGSVLIVDLRLLGLWRRIPLALVADVATPVAAVGFVIRVETVFTATLEMSAARCGSPERTT